MSDWKKSNGEPPNVVNMAEARRRQKTLKRQGASSDGKFEAKKPTGPIATKFWAVVQIALFMFVFYIGMRSCSGG